MDFVPVEHDPFGSAVVAKNFPPELNPPGDPNPLAEALLKGGQYQGPQTPPAWARAAVVDAARPFLDAGQYVGGVMAGNVKPTVADTITNLGGAALAVAAPPGARGVAALEREALPAGEAAARGIRAYHGSPHDFDQFDLSKIGTGEGAQAYGHGMYFAENEGTARSYRDSLSDQKPRQVGSDPNLTLPSWVANKVASRNPAAINDVRTDFQGRLADMRRQLADPNTMQPWNIEANIPGIESILKALDHVEAGHPIAPAGRMYEVNINAHPDQFLDWDKPLSEQSPHVRSVYQKLTGATDPADAAGRVRSLQEQMDALGQDRDPVTNQMRNEPKWHQLARDRDAAWNEWNLAQSGQKFYHNLPKVTYSIRDNPADKWRASGASTLEDAMQLVGGDKSRVLQVNTPGKDIAAQRLHQAGIPGIKYLDQGSRGSGTGTSNYVVFDPNLIDIVKKYGVAGLGAFPVGSSILYPVDNDPFAKKRASGGRVVATNVDLDPTEAQKEAGNYAKDHVSLHGLDIAIENPKGGVRSGVGRDGKPWSVKMPAHYGYIKGTVGRDKDHVDVYLGPQPKSPHVFVVDQVDAETKKFDEHKVMLGFGSRGAARRAYLAAFSDTKGHRRLGHMAEMPVAGFKDWLASGNTREPIKAAPQAEKLAHSAVGYATRSALPGKHCAACTMFLPERGGPGCTLVRDPISPQGWCRRFSPKKKD